MSYWPIYAPPTMHGILISLSRLQPFSVPPSSSSSIWNRALPFPLFFIVSLSLALALALSVSLRSSTPRGASSANETSVSYRRLVPPAFTVELLWNYLRDFTEKPRNLLMIAWISIVSSFPSIRIELRRWFVIYIYNLILRHFFMVFSYL